MRSRDHAAANEDAVTLYLDTDEENGTVTIEAKLEEDEGGLSLDKARMDLAERA